MTVLGVGPITSLYFKATVDDPTLQAIEKCRRLHLLVRFTPRLAMPSALLAPLKLFATTNNLTNHAGGPHECVRECNASGVKIALCQAITDKAVCALVK